MQILNVLSFSSFMLIKELKHWCYGSRVMQSLKLCLFMMMVFCVDLMNMDQQLVQADTGTMLETGPLVVALIVQNPLLLDHDTICSLAYVNKSCNKLILDGVPQRKKFLIQYDSAVLENTTLFGTGERSKKLFHKYGGSYAVAEQWTHSDYDTRTLILLRRYLTGNGKMAHASCTFHYFSSFVDENLTPFCNEKGIISFYGYGKLEYASEYCLIRYDLDETIFHPRFPCYLHVKDQKGYTISQGLIKNVSKTPDLYLFLQNNKLSLNIVSAFKKNKKRYSFFGERWEECVMIELIKEK